MKAWMATAATLALLAGLSTASAQNAPAGANDKTSVTMDQSAAPKAKVSSHKIGMRHAMRTRHHMARETTGFGGRRTLGGGRNDPSIHQSAGDRDSRDFPKQH